MPVPLSSVGRGTYTTPGQAVPGGGDWFASQGVPSGPNYGFPEGYGANEATDQGPDAWGGYARRNQLAQHRSNPQALQQIQQITGMSLESAQEILAGQGGPGLQAEMTRRLTQAGLLAPGAAPPAPSGGTPGGRMSNAQAQQFFDQLFPGGTVTPQDLEAHRAELEGAGFTLNPNAGGLITDLTLPSGDTVDPIYGAGSGENRKQWLVHAQGEGGGPLGELQRSPGYQFRLAEGAKALERSAAARGTLLTGGTLKGLARYGQDYASGEYNTRYNQLMGVAGLGANAAGAQAGANTSYANQAGDLQTQRGNAQAGGTVGQANAVNSAIGGATNLAQMYYLSRLYGGGGGGAAGGGAGASPYGPYAGGYQFPPPITG